MFSLFLCSVVYALPLLLQTPSPLLLFPPILSFTGSIFWLLSPHALRLRPHVLPRCDDGGDDGGAGSESRVGLHEQQAPDPLLFVHTQSPQSFLCSTKRTQNLPQPSQHWHWLLRILFLCHFFPSEFTRFVRGAAVSLPQLCLLS